MTPLEKACARLKDLAAALKTLTEKDILSADDLTSINAKTDEIEACEREIETLERAEQARARTAVPAGADVPAADRVVSRGHNGAPALIQREPDLDANRRICLLGAAFLKAKSNDMPRGAAIDLIRDAGFRSYADELNHEYAVMRAVTVGTPAGIGTNAPISSIIPESLAGPFVDILRPATTFLQGGPKPITFVNGQFNQPKGLTSASAAYVGEGAKKPVGQPTFGTQGMVPKKLAGIVLITEEARDWSVLAIEEYIRDDLRKVMSNTWDLQAYLGTGAGDSPTGIFNAAGITTVTHTFVDPYNPTIAELDAVARKMTLSLNMANIALSSKWAWVMDYRTLGFLQDVRNEHGLPVYESLQGANPTWKGIRILVSTAFPINGGAGTDEAMLGLVDFSEVLYGEDKGLVVKAATEASVDVSGTLVHLWQQNMFGVLMEMRHNWMLQRPKGVAVLEGIQWGATDPTP